MDIISLPVSRRSPELPTQRHELELGVASFGYARLTAAEIAGSRRQIPKWAVAGTPGHFFKYSDEQTIMAVRAIDQAIERDELNVQDQANFAVIAAPQFLGRVSGSGLFHRFLRDGAPSVSPHIIPQHSLHSVSGAISVLLGCRGPNIGVGGGPNALDDALLSVATLFEPAAIGGVWLVCTAWDPEPTPDREGTCTNEPVCHAFALAVSGSAAAASRGTVRFDLSSPLTQVASESADMPTPMTVARIVSQLMKLDQGQLPQGLQWQMSWGGRVEMKLSRRTALRSLAA